MKCYFRSFDVGIGDCNVIRLVKGSGEQYVIMVDCGKYTKRIKKYIEEELHNHIDLLIATHIDEDHILGLTQLLKEHNGLTVEKIWYNAYRRRDQTEKVVLNAHQIAVLQQIQKMLPVEFDALNYRQISAPQGKTLAQTILDDDTLRDAWNISPITSETEDFTIPGGWGKIVFLSPLPDALEEIDKKFKNEFNKRFMQVWNESLERGEELQELLIRFAESEVHGYIDQFVSAHEGAYNAAFVRQQANIEDKDDSVTNYASIAFMLECGEHKVAMLGDAFADILANTIKDKYPDEPKPIECEAIKVSHHGSNGNSSRELYERINSHRYYIPGGKDEQYPSWGTLGRIAEVVKDEKVKQVIFSRPCAITNQMRSLSADTQKDLGVSIKMSESEDELFEW
jgi:beta-lactamase superfamily II metal-dependent hydrolase